MRYILLLYSFITVQASTVFASGAEQADTLKSYRLGEIIVTSEKNARLLTPTEIQNIPYRTINKSDNTALSGLSLYIPASSIKTNSRGETLLFIRGAAERQLSIFFDGVPVNLPWDNRLDLSVIPTEIIGNISLNKGASSILYGANALGGAVNITTIERPSDGMGADLRFIYNDANSKDISLTHDGRIGDFNYIVNCSYLNSDGFLMSDKAAYLINQNPDSKLRTNTDQKRISTYIRAEYKLSESTAIGLSVNHIDAEKGVAPEAHITSKVRFWRYPLWRRTIITLNGEHVFSKKNSAALRTAAWFDNFGHKIDYYSDISYSEIESKESLDERNFGARISYQTEAMGDDRLTFAFSGLNSENDFKSDEEGDFDYNQKIYSGGMEYMKRFGPLAATAGVSYDGSAASKAAGDSSIDDDGVSGLGANIGLKYLLSDEMNIYGAVMQKTRFATLREKYSTGGGKFILNPDLKQESGILTELGFEYLKQDFRLTLAAFGNFYDDLIAQKNNPDKTRIRVNIDKSRIIGIEAGASYSPVQSLNLDCHITYLNARKETDGAYNGELDYIPEIISGFAGSYQFDNGLSAAVEMEYIGKQGASNAAAGGDYEYIGPTLIFNARIAYRFVAGGITANELFVRVNNIGDIYKLSQFGIPEPGRMFSAGVNVRI